MSWRVVVINNRCKLDYCMNYMVVRGEETKRVLLDEIAILILENNAVSMTGCLLSELIEKKIKVVLCDNRRNPQAELVPYYGAHNDSLKIKQQIDWNSELKTVIWTNIVAEKIRNQARMLERYGKSDEMDILLSYCADLKPGDSTNREGHAAKVYFNALFGMDFVRNDDNDYRNAGLNYGYTVLLSAFNREICSNGYLTQLGLGHDNQFNHYNLGSDLMEPYRILIDDRVVNCNFNGFGTNEKHFILDVLNLRVKIRDSEQTVLNAIKIYTKSVFDALNESDPDRLLFFDYEL